MSNKEHQLSEAIEAALDKKAQEAVVIELGGICSFTDYFLICTGTSTRHNQTIAESIEETLKMLEVYRYIVEDLLAIPVIIGEKSPGERRGAQAERVP